MTSLEGVRLIIPWIVLLFISGSGHLLETIKFSESDSLVGKIKGIDAGMIPPCPLPENPTVQLFRVYVEEGNFLND